MTNVLLITPFNVPFKDIKDTLEIKRKIAPKYPVGLMCIGAYVKKKCPGTNVIMIVDYNVEMQRYFAHTKTRYLQNMLSYGLSLVPFYPDIIGISAMFDSNFTDMKGTVDYFKIRYPNSIIVAGGHLASACYKEFLAMGFDAVCYGEGELPMLGLAHACKNEFETYYMAESSAWVTRQKLKGNPEFKPVNSMIQNLDDIPPYDLSMLQWPEDYLNTNDDLFALGTERHEKDIYMFATRGCPYHCIFCASQFVHGHKVRSYSSARIKHDILKYHFEYGITSFPFLDDHFLADKEKALDILDFIEKNKFTCRIFNLNYIHVDRDIVQALKRTGSDRLLITLDGLDERFLRKVVRKPADFRKAKEVIRICRDEKIVVLANIIIGYPGETKEDIENGAEAIAAMGANWYSILVAAPLHGSELRKICEEKGYLASECENIRVDYYTANIATPEFTPEWITKKAYEINLDLNFVHNYDMSIGEYETPLKLFERVMEIEPNHAFAYLFAARCAREIGEKDYALGYEESYWDIWEKYPMWREWAEHFKLKEI